MGGVEGRLDSVRYVSWFSKLQWQCDGRLIRNLNCLRFRHDDAIVGHS